MSLFVVSGHVSVGRFTRRILESAAICLFVSAGIAAASDVADPVTGRGHLAQTLDGIETVEISADALLEAADGSLAAKLLSYQRARRALEGAVAAQNDAYAMYKDAAELNNAENETNAHLEADVIAAARHYNRLQQRAEKAQFAAEAALDDLSGGQLLSDIAMMELHGMLGL